MLIRRKFTTSAVAAVAATAAIVAAPAAAMTLSGSIGADRTVVADNGYGGPDGQCGGGGCGDGANWQGCGGWNPVTGGFGHGCINGLCGGWDGSRGWGG